MNAIVESLFIGRPKNFKKPNLKSSINRDSVDQIKVQLSNIVGDEVSNKKYHGGENRVIHFFPKEHYQYFRSNYNQDIFSHGSIGENITTSLLNETNVHIGDIFRVGSVTCQITEPRFPCGIIDLQYDIRGMNKDCLKARKLGWFAKVLNEGKINLGDEIILEKRTDQNLSLDIIIKAINSDGLDDILNLMVSSPTLSDNWKDKAKRKLGN